MRFLFIFSFFLLFSGIGILQSQDFEFIAQHEGTSTSVGHYDNYIYFNTGGSINILKKDSVNEFSLINKFHCYIGCNDITLDSNYLFVAVHKDGVAIYDISDPENPILEKLTGPFTFEGTLVSDTILIAFTGGNVYLYDISDLNQLNIVSTLPYPLNFNNAFALNNNILYGFMKDGPNAPEFLIGYNISDPNNPAIAATYQLNINDQIPWPSDMKVNNNKLYVAFNDTLKIFDISEPASIEYLTQYSFHNSICNLQIEDNTGYIAIDTSIYVFDFANPFNGEIISQYNLEGTAKELMIYNNYIATAKGFKGFEIANKEDNQSLYKVYDFKKTNAIYALHIDQNLAYLSMGDNGLQVMDVSNLNNPIYCGNEENIPRIDFIEPINGHLLCRENYENIIYTINVVDSTNPMLVSEVEANHGWINDYCTDQDRLFIIDSLEFIEIYDLSFPEFPNLLTEINIPGKFLDVENSFMVVYEIHVNESSQYENKIKLYSIENINAISFMDEIIIEPRPILDIRLDYPYIYIWSSYSVVVLKIENNLIVYCDEITFGVETYHFAMDERFIYLSGHYDADFQLKIIDITDPYNLEQEYYVSSWYTGVMFPFNKKLCVTRGESGIYFYNLEKIWNNSEYEPIKTKNINCYPNPCVNHTTISLTDIENKKVMLLVYNIAGQLVESLNSTANTSIKLNTSNYETGIYICSVRTPTVSYSSKFIVMH